MMGVVTKQVKLVLELLHNQRKDRTLDYTDNEEEQNK